MAYEILDHTADIGLKISSQTLSDIFIESAQGLGEVLFIGKIDPIEQIKISLEADTPEELFHDWLSEINYYFLVHQKMFSTFKVEKIESTNLEIICFGEVFDETKHQLITEIKAVTYHQLYIKEEAGKWKAQVIFDV